MSAEAKELYEAHQRIASAVYRPFHIVPQWEQDAWKAVEEAAEKDEELEDLREQNAYLEGENEAMTHSIEDMQKQTQRLLENVGPKTSKANLLMVINALRVELAKCVTT